MPSASLEFVAPEKAPSLLGAARGSAAVFSVERGQDGGVLSAYGLQLSWVQAKQAQDGRRDLGGQNWAVDDFALVNAGPADEDRDTAICRRVAAMLGDLALAAGVHHARLGEPDDIRNPGVV